MLGLHAVALSPASGLWTGLKVVADIADGGATVDVDGLATAIPDLPPRRHRAARAAAARRRVDAERRP